MSDRYPGYSFSVPATPEMLAFLRREVERHRSVRLAVQFSEPPLRVLYRWHRAKLNMTASEALDAGRTAHDRIMEHGMKLELKTSDGVEMTTTVDVKP